MCNVAGFIAKMLPIERYALKTVSKSGQRGYDAGKRVKGRRRHIASDTMGLLLAVVVHSAGIQDRAGAKALLIRLFLHFDSLDRKSVV